ncbi:hypothetical protein QMG83_03165 [Salinibacterium sp. G-O1]|uniref:hypothetical protein n=1 Tax=Salinibacterium sp. G-O1 TaxID=3046208 RepID=UPI0024B9FBCE|nr:hypothetical protein [Salinibacterium sp. G-O1]MDJ0334219.1 hypothetical protein [Salinibacterium sp. G-O1]
MAACVSCSTELDPLWKYCITCGTPVVMAEPHEQPDTPPIPAAIRPDQPASVTGLVRGLPKPALVVIVLAVIGSIGSFVALAMLFR